MIYRALLFFLLLAPAFPCLGQDTVTFCTGSCCYVSEEELFDCRLRHDYTYQTVKPYRCEQYVFYTDRKHPNRGTFRRTLSEFDTQIESTGTGGGTFTLTDDGVILQSYKFTIAAYDEKDSLGYFPRLKHPAATIAVKRTQFLKDKPVSLADCRLLTLMVGAQTIRYRNITRVATSEHR